MTNIQDMARPKMTDVQVSLRLPDTTTVRASKLADKLSELDTFRVFHPSGVTAAAVYRLALLRGLDALEQEFHTTKKSR